MRPGHVLEGDRFAFFVQPSAIACIVPEAVLDPDDDPTEVLEDESTAFRDVHSATQQGMSFGECRILTINS